MRHDQAGPDQKKSAGNDAAPRENNSAPDAGHRREISGGKAHSPSSWSHKRNHKHDFPASLLYPVSDAPPATNLHRPSGELTHFWNRDAPIPLLHKNAANALEPELGCQGEADRTAATNENRDGFFFSSTHPFKLPIPPL